MKIVVDGMNSSMHFFLTSIRQAFNFGTLHTINIFIKFAKY
jgi:hypothetical protein